MFFRVFLLFALVAAAFAKPEPQPQVLTYAAPGVLPAVGYAGYSGYSAYQPVAYSAPYAGYPYAYSAGYYVK